MAQSRVQQLPLTPKLPAFDSPGYDRQLNRALHDALRIAAAKLAELEARIKTLEGAP